MMALPVDDTPSEAFQWGAGGARMTPEAIAAQRKAAADAKNGLDYAPIRSPWQGVAKVAQSLLGALDSRDASNAEKANASDNAKMIAALLSGGGGGAPVAASGAEGATPATAAPSPDTTGKIYNNDEPSPLDPPSGTDRDNMIRTVYGEAGNEPTAGQLAVANVIRTRAVDGGYGGDTPTAVVRAPNQFEPWNGGPARDRMLALSPSDPKYQAISKVVDASYGTGGRAPEDPTEGMTHFYSPAGQTAMGRAAPAWAGGDSVTIGGHVFNSPDDAKPGVQVASADPAAIPASAAPAPAASPAVAKVSGALAGVNPAVLAAVTSPYASESTKKIAGLLLAQQMTPKDVHTQETDAKGNIWDVNKQTGQRTVSLKTDAETPKWGIVGKDQYGQPTYGYPPSREQAAAAKATPAAAVTDGPDLTNVHGEEYMGTLVKADPKYASTVRAIVEGRAPYPTGMLLKTPYGQKLAQDVTQADTTFESGNSTARVKVRNEFKSGGVGSPAGQITAGNAAIQHAGEMSDSLEQMKANPGLMGVGEAGIPFVSYYANKFHNAAVQGTPEGAPLNDFKTAKNHFSEEVTKFYAGSAGSEAERARALANIDEAKSLPELQSAIRKEAGLMQDKVNVLQERWRTGMGPLVPDFPLIHPKSQEALDRITQRAQGVPAASTAVGPGGAPAAPVKVASPDEARKLPKGTQIILPDGSPGVVP